MEKMNVIEMQNINAGAYQCLCKKWGSSYKICNAVYSSKALMGWHFIVCHSGQKHTYKTVK